MILDEIKRLDKNTEFNIIIEENDSMTIWSEKINEFIKFSKDYFKNVEVLFIKEDLVLPDLNSDIKLTFLFTNFVSENWGNSKGYSFLETLSNKTFLSVINPLPQRIWKRTILDNTWRIKFTHRTEFNNNSLISNIDEKECGVTENIRIPISNIEKISIKHLVNLLQDEKDVWVYGSLFEKREFRYSLQTEHFTEDTPEDTVKMFDIMSSPEAQELAIYLSVLDYFNIEQLKAIQKEIFPVSNEIHLSEIFLNGILKRKKGSENVYEMIPEIKEILSEKLYDHKKDEILNIWNKK